MADKKLESEVEITFTVHVLSSQFLLFQIPGDEKACRYIRCVGDTKNKIRIPLSRDVISSRCAYVWHYVYDVGWNQATNDHDHQPSLHIEGVAEIQLTEPTKKEYWFHHPGHSVTPGYQVKLCVLEITTTLPFSTDDKEHESCKLICSQFHKARESIWLDTDVQQQLVNHHERKLGYWSQSGMMTPFGFALPTWCIMAPACDPPIHYPEHYLLFKHLLNVVGERVFQSLMPEVFENDPLQTTLEWYNCLSPTKPLHIKHLLSDLICILPSRLPYRVDAYENGKFKDDQWSWPLYSPKLGHTGIDCEDGVEMALCTWYTLLKLEPYVEEQGDPYLYAIIQTMKHYEPCLAVVQLNNDPDGWGCHAIAMAINKRYFEECLATNRHHRVTQWADDVIEYPNMILETVEDIGFIHYNNCRGSPSSETKEEIDADTHHRVMQAFNPIQHEYIRTRTIGASLFDAGCNPHYDQVITLTNPNWIEKYDFGEFLVRSSSTNDGFITATQLLSHDINVRWIGCSYDGKSPDKDEEKKTSLRLLKWIKTYLLASYPGLPHISFYLKDSEWRMCKTCLRNPVERECTCSSHTLTLPSPTTTTIISFNTNILAWLYSIAPLAVHLNHATVWIRIHSLCDQFDSIDVWVIS